MSESELPESKSLRKRFPALAALVLVLVCNILADLLLKAGAEATKGSTVLGSWFTIAGIGCHLVGFVAWAYTLRTIPLAVAFSFVSGHLVVVPVAAWLLFEGGWWGGGHFPLLRWVGVAVVMLGVMLLVPAIVEAEEKTEKE